MQGQNQIDLHLSTQGSTFFIERISVQRPTLHEGDISARRILRVAEPERSFKAFPTHSRIAASNFGCASVTLRVGSEEHGAQNADKAARTNILKTGILRI